MKNFFKNISILILALFILYGFCELAKLRFGYVKNGIKINRNSYNEDYPRTITELNNGNVLFSGDRAFVCEYNDKKVPKIIGIKETPFQIYNPKTNKIADEFNLPANFIYSSNNVLLLENNKIVITNAHYTKDTKCFRKDVIGNIKNHSVNHNLIILYDLNKKQVEKIIRKDIQDFSAKYYTDSDEDFEHFLNEIMYTALNDKILAYYPDTGIVEIFNFENGESEIIESEELLGKDCQKIIRNGDNILFFLELKGDIFIYKYDNKSIKLFKQVKNIYTGLHVPYILNIKNSPALIGNCFDSFYDINTETLRTYKNNLLGRLYRKSNPKITFFNNGKYLLVLNAVTYGSYFWGFSYAYVLNVNTGSRQPAFYKSHELDNTTILKLKNGDILINDNNKIKIFKPWVK